ncbi:MAG: O-antigen ligase family protein [Arenibacter algicola]
MKALFNYINSIGFVLSGLLALYLLDPFNKGFLFGYLLVILIILKKKYISQNLDGDVFLLTLFSIIYAIFYTFEPLAGNQYIVIYALFPQSFYLLGKYLASNIKDPKTLFIILFYIASIFSFSAVISVFLNFREGGFAQLDRTIPMFWNDQPTSATIMGGFLTLNMCIPAILISGHRQISILNKIIAALLFVISLICAIRLGSRTQLVIFLFTSIVSVLYIFPRQTYKQNMYLFIFIIMCIGFILRNVSFDLNADWLTTFAGRMSGGSGDVASGGGRTQRWIKSFEYLFTHPLGWDAKEFGYSHNMWLDVLRAGGIIPFLLLIIYTLKSIFQIKKTVLLKKENSLINGQILSYGIAFFLLFMVEPIFEGLFSLFVVFCLYKGILNKYYTNFSQ